MTWGRSYPRESEFNPISDPTHAVVFQAWLVSNFGLLFATYTCQGKDEHDPTRPIVDVRCTSPYIWDRSDTLQYVSTGHAHATTIAALVAIGFEAKCVNLNTGPLEELDFNQAVRDGAMEIGRRAIQARMNRQASPVAQAANNRRGRRAAAAKKRRKRR